MATPPRPSTISPKDALGLAIKRMRRRAEMTQEQSADAMDVAVSSWRRYEWGERGLDVDKLDEVARAIRSTRDELLEEQRRILEGAEPHDRPARSPLQPASRGLEASAAMLPIRDRVQAGAWLAADDAAQAGKAYPSVKDPRFPHAAQWLSEVVGDSLDRLPIFDGDLVHCVDLVDSGYYPKNGDLVEVERLRFGGSERELTIKEVEVTPSGVLLWPRSNNPRWQEPLSLSDGTGDGEEVEVRIRALVIAAIRRF